MGGEISYLMYSGALLWIPTGAFAAKTQKFENGKAAGIVEASEDIRATNAGTANTKGVDGNNPHLSRFLSTYSLIHASVFFLNFEPHLGHVTSLCFIPQLTQ